MMKYSYDEVKVKAALENIRDLKQEKSSLQMKIWDAESALKKMLMAGEIDGHFMNLNISRLEKEFMYKRI